MKLAPVTALLRPGPLRRRVLGVIATLAFIALAWTLAIGWWLPRLLQPRIEAAAMEALGTPLTLERLEIAPWRLEASVHGLRLGPPAAPWLRVAEVRADVSSESLWRFAPVLERLQVREPQLELERIEGDRFNVTPMLEALARRPSAGLQRFALHNIRLDGGRIRLVDHVARAEHRVEALRIGIPFISSLPSQVAIDVEPLLDAEVNGSHLHLQGKTRPFSEGRHSMIDVNWRQIDLPRWLAAIAPLLPQALPVDLQRGRLDLVIQIGFEHRTAPAVSSLRIAGRATVSELTAAAPAQGAQFGLDQMVVEGIEALPLERRATVGSVSLQAPVFDLELARLSGPPAPAASSASSASSGDAPPWQWRIGKVALAAGRVQLRDPAWPEGPLIAPIEAVLSGLDSHADAAPAVFAASLSDGEGAQGKLDGTLGVATRRAVVKAEVSGLKLAPWIAPWQERLPVRIAGGSIALQAQAEAGPSGWTLHDGALRLADLELQPAVATTPTARQADRLKLPLIEAKGVQLRAEADRPLAAEVASLRLDALDLQASRGERGEIAWLPRTDLKPMQRPPAVRDNAPALAWRLGELGCVNCSVALTDRGAKPETKLALMHADLTLRKLGSDATQPIDFELAAQTGSGGRIHAGGQGRRQPLTLHSRLELAAFDLGLLQPYIAPYLNVTLVKAKASAAGELRVEGGERDAIASARWRGKLALNNLRMLDRLNAAEFIAFKALMLDGTDIAWRPMAVEADLGNVALEDFYGRVIINADGRINLRDIVKSEGDKGPRSLTTPSGPAASSQGEAASAAATASRPAQLRWRAIRLARGEIDFTDNFIRPNYSARLTDIAGRVSALAWNDPQPADVSVAGKVDDGAPLEIAGTIHPLGARLHTDLTATARGIDITRLSAYAARYAGYGVEKGTLSAKVHYRVDNGKLEAENNLVLDRLTFGAKVESPDALKLPVLLAVALLKDRNGVIDVNLPVSGSLDDPQFSIGGIIARVVVNMITKAVTAPFTLLAHAFAGRADTELGFVEFAPGSADLDDEAKRRLDALAKALNDRPALKLEATGRADPAIDTAALRQARVEQAMRAAKAKETGEAIDGVKIDAAERPRWLEAAYKAADIKGKPRNVIGLQKTLPEGEMEAMLQQSAAAGPEQLRALADARGDRVKAYLTGKVPPERVLLTASRPDAAGMDDKDRTTRVSFALK